LHEIKPKRDLDDGFAESALVSWAATRSAYL
jgi:hypothetical protein